MVLSGVGVNILGGRVNQSESYVMPLREVSLVVGGDGCHGDLAVGSDAVCLGAEGEQSGSAGTGMELELRQVVDKEVDLRCHGTQTVLNVPEGSRQ